MKKISVNIKIDYTGHDKYLFYIYDVEEITRAHQSIFFKFPCAKWFGTKEAKTQSVVMMFAIMTATKNAISSGYNKITFNDLKYIGYSNWFSGKWKTNNEYTAKYAEFMHKATQYIEIGFV